MYQQQLSDKNIIEGFRKGNSEIIREYFYGYCRTGYYGAVENFRGYA